MNKVIDLIEGANYFLVGFYDDELTQQCITSLVYEGVNDDNKIGHLFLRLDGGGYICHTEGKIGSIVDKENLIKWLQHNHSPQATRETYEYRRP